MATLQITYHDRVKVWEEQARGGISLEVGRDRDGKPRLLFAGCPASGAHDELLGCGSLADALELLSDLEGVELVTLNGSTVWSLARAQAEREASAALEEAEGALGDLG